MNFLKRVFRWACRKLGLEIRRISRGHNSVPGDRLVEFFQMLRTVTGFSPKTIYDIGANRGHWTTKIMQVFPDADFVMFEPQAHLGSQLDMLMRQHMNVTWRRCAVSDHCGTAEFAQYDWDVCSRLASDVDASWDDQGKRVTVELTTINDEVKRFGAVPDILKIDAEGHDFQVLDGAADVLGKVELVIVEASICCPTVDNTVRRVIDRMWEEGYALCGIVDLNEFHISGKQLHGLLWLADLAFCRKDSEMLAKLQEPMEESKKELAGAGVWETALTPHPAKV